MYAWWVSLSVQATPEELNDTFKRLIIWGAVQLPSGNMTEGHWGFSSKVNPTRFLNSISPEKVIERWGFFSRGQTKKPKRNPSKKPGPDKQKEFAILKSRLGTNLKGGKT